MTQATTPIAHECRCEVCGQAMSELAAPTLSACFAVVQSNYEPLEVDSLWAHKEDAESRAFYLGNSWRVRELQIHQHANDRTELRAAETARSAEDK